jgi:hypothetical protein
MDAIWLLSLNNLLINAADEDIKGKAILVTGCEGP